MIQKPKVKLSPRMRQGVGRSTGRGSLLPYATLITLVISAIFVVRTISLIATKGSSSDTPIQGSVLGASDTPAPKQMFKDYAVQKGDTIFSIGQSNNIDWTELATLNGLKAPFTLKPGQTLKIPQQ
jgi:LysM repeat protein